MDRYTLAAPIYDACTLLWSGGAIWRGRRAALEGLGPGDRVLIPGPGTGRSAVHAARLRATVVLVESSATMARRARRRCARAGVQVTLVEGAFGEVEVGGDFDLVLAEHFLNVFDAAEMPNVRRALIGAVRPGGRLAIADFTPAPPGARGGPQRLYHALPLGGCAVLTANAFHPIYDHGRDLAAEGGLTLERTYDARIFGLGPGWFRTWVFRKGAQPASPQGPGESPARR